MPGCRPRSNWPSTASMPSCSRPTSWALAPAPAMAARSAAASMSARASPGRTAEVDAERVERHACRTPADAFALIDRLIDEEKIDCFWEKPGRFVGAWTKKHFDAQIAPACHAQCGGAVRRLHGAARAAARRDRQRLLFRRHGRRAVGQVASGALLQGPARGMPPAQRRRLRQGHGHSHRPGGQRLAGRNRPRRGSRPAMS